MARPKLRFKQILIALSLLLALFIGYAYGFSRGHVTGCQEIEQLLRQEIETARMSLEAVRQDRQAEMAQLKQVNQSYGVVYELLKEELGWIDAEVESDE